MMSPRRTDKILDEARRLVAEALATKKNTDPVKLAMARWGTAAPVFYEKAPVAGSLDDGSFHESTTFLLDLVLEQSAVGRLGLREVPMYARAAAVDTGMWAYFVGQGKAKPISRMVLSSRTLSPKKIAATTVVSNELLAANNPAAENLILADLIRAVAGALDEQFLSASAGDDATPPGVLSGVLPVTAYSNVAESIGLLIAAFQGDLSRAVFCARPDVFATIAGSNLTGRIGLRDGALLAAPTIVSRYAPADSLLLIDPLRIAYATTGIETSNARGGAIEMESAPVGASSADVGSPPGSPPDIEPVPHELG
jgi:hypothetical protein